MRPRRSPRMASASFGTGSSRPTTAACAWGKSQSQRPACGPRELFGRCGAVSSWGMCLGIPGKVVEKFEQQGLLMGKVDFGGVQKQVCLEHTKDVQPGQFVIVHVGFALQVIDEDEARQIFDFLDRMNELRELAIDSGATQPAHSRP